MKSAGNEDRTKITKVVIEITDKEHGPVHQIWLAKRASPLHFVLVVFALSIPFWLAGSVIDLQVLPGLPVSSFMWICPATAASILVFRESKIEGVTLLLKRSFDYERVRPRGWYVPITLLLPGATLLSYGLAKSMGLPIPVPQLSGRVVLVMFVALFPPALGEELGWSGYVIDPLQERWGALEAGILLGLVSAVWHVAPLVQAHRSPAWIAWWALFTVASRILLTWLYNNSGKSVFAAALYHDMSNLCWQTFPNRGSHWSPKIMGLILAAAAIAVSVIWGPRSLSRAGKTEARV